MNAENLIPFLREAEACFRSGALAAESPKDLRQDNVRESKARVRAVLDAFGMRALTENWEESGKISFAGIVLAKI